VFNYAPRLKDVWGSGGIAPRILNLGTRWRFTPQLLQPRERIPSTRWIGGWMGPRAGDEKKEIPTPAGNWKTVVHPLV